MRKLLPSAWAHLGIGNDWDTTATGGLAGVLHMCHVITGSDGWVQHSQHPPPCPECKLPVDPVQGGMAAAALVVAAKRRMRGHWKRVPRNCRKGGTSFVRGLCTRDIPVICAMSLFWTMF
jgi:hypothetical protein